MQVLLIICQRREIAKLVDFLSDWKTAGGNILLYGYTNKATDGFILMQWDQPIPTGFQENQLKQDPGIIDYLIYDVLQPVTIVV
ncbi:MAG: hypothetical protein NVSMB44_04450 [Ktedonobacteraceae bacterium]